jgi:long-chain acyl-CoA synthetase
MIIASGFNIYPNEVEAVAAACTGVAECACVGRPDEKTGEAVRLFIAKASGATLTEADVIAHCRRDLAAYKVPKDVRFLDALPKSNVGKILRKDLRALALGSPMTMMDKAMPPKFSRDGSGVRRP